jgi:ribosomal protein L28
MPFTHIAKLSENIDVQLLKVASINGQENHLYVSANTFKIIDFLLS